MRRFAHNNACLPLTYKCYVRGRGKLDRILSSVIFSPHLLHLKIILKLERNDEVHLFAPSRDELRLEESGTS